jgi:hypothetical protein
METLEKEPLRGIQWGINKQLTDIDCADDICILIHKIEDLQEKLSILNREGKKRGLKISTKKTEVMKVYNNSHNSQFKIGNDVLKPIILLPGIFGKLWWWMPGRYINRRNKARAAFNSLLPKRNAKKTETEHQD